MDFLKENLNTIIKGDCLEKLKDFPNRSVDFIFADPPYFMQTEGELKRFEGTKFQGVEDHWDKFGSFKEYDAFCLGWLKRSQ
uniref:site-specific DNA-methyltransferase n=1 Tax=Helicobacter pylori TaxID=210 RepID=UPI0015C55A33